MDDSSIKLNIFKFRTALGLSQREMAQKLGISLTAYRKIEVGKTRILNENIEKLASAAGTSVSKLVNGFEPSPEPENLEDARNAFQRKLSEMEEGYLKTIAALKEEIRLLRERLADKEAVIETDKKLIARYEKELFG